MWTALTTEELTVGVTTIAVCFALVVALYRITRNQTSNPKAPKSN